MTTPEWYKRLDALKACPHGLKWAGRDRTYQELWDAFERGDWMMWMLAHGTNVDKKKFLVCALGCLGRVLLDCPAGGEGSIPTVTTEPISTDDRVELAAAVTMPYEHGPHAEKLKTWKRLADVVRSHFPQPPELPM